MAVSVLVWHNILPHYYGFDHIVTFIVVIVLVWHKWFILPKFYYSNTDDSICVKKKKEDSVYHVQL